MNAHKSFVLIICIGLIIGALIKYCVVDVLHVSGRSMSPALKDGDTLIVNKLAYGLNIPYGGRLLFQWAEPAPGDIVIYLYNNKIVVKRCVAVSGTPLEYSVFPQYTLHVGDTAISLTETQFQNMKSSTQVPDGYILAIGDNYAESVDSRTYGFVAVHNMLGKVVSPKVAER
ncbi:MAG: signal peptidase I [Treponema sp.]|nr:signal peptidase I [Treponema sp.]